MGCGVSKKVVEVESNKTEAPNAGEGEQGRASKVPASCASQVKGRNSAGRTSSVSEMSDDKNIGNRIVDTLGVAGEKVGALLGDGATLLANGADSMSKAIITRKSDVNSSDGSSEFDKRAIAMQKVWRGKKARDLADRRFAQQACKMPAVMLAHVLFMKSIQN